MGYDPAFKLKIGSYFLLLFLFYCLQTSRGTEILLMGHRLDALPCLVAAVALLDGPVAGAMIGFSAGVFYDLSMLGADGLYPAYYLAFGLAAGIFGQRYLRKVFPSVLLLSAIALVGINLVRMIVLVWIYEVSFGRVLLTSVIDLFLMALICPIAYGSVHAVQRKLSQR